MTFRVRLSKPTPQATPRVSAAVLCVVLESFTLPALGQTVGAESPAVRETAEATGAKTDATSDTTAANPAMPETTATPSKVAEELEKLKARVAELEAKQQPTAGETTAPNNKQSAKGGDSADVDALLAGGSTSAEAADVAPEKLRLYGFMDMGLQRTFAPKNGMAAATLGANALTFAVGNINQYFDYTPHPDWRGLAEIRFTMAPHGNVTAGGLDPLTGKIQQFNRLTTEQYDPHATAQNTPMWGGYTVIERAYIQWQKYQQFQLRVGHWFSPFGVWNVDHGQPTLIAATTPQLIQMKLIPIRQTGIQVLGSFVLSDWELGYNAWLSNGRNEIAVLDVNDDKAFGGRIFVRKDTGSFNYQLGATYHHGRVADKIAEANPTKLMAYNIYESYAYTENIFGADLSVDIGPFRSRTEWVGRLKRYQDDKRPAAFGAPGAYAADAWSMSLYTVMAYQLPWWGIEPFMAGEWLSGALKASDGIYELAQGFNIHFNESVLLKCQSTYTGFYNTPGLSSFDTVVARLVMAY